MHYIAATLIVVTAIFLPRPPVEEPPQPTPVVEEVKVKKKKKIVYKVKQGDTLSQIASNYPVSWGEIAIKNKLKNTVLDIGQKLTIPEKGEVNKKKAKNFQEKHTKVVAPTVEAVVSQPVLSGDWVARCHRWAEMAGITLPPEAITLISRESHCNPVAQNPSSSAGGIPQALPWTKMGCGLATDDATAVCQLKWMLSYVMSRYGSWQVALDHSYANGWY